MWPPTQDTYEVCLESIQPFNILQVLFFLKKGHNLSRTMAPLSPSKYSPWDHAHSYQHSFHFSKQYAKSFFGIAISYLITFSLMSSTVWNLLPFNDEFSSGKSQKSQGAKSGLEGVWQNWVMWCFAKEACTRAAEWAGALSWWSCHHHLAVFFLLHPSASEGLWCSTP